MKSQQRGRSGLLMDLHHAPKCITIPPGDARLEKNSDDGAIPGCLVVKHSRVSRKPGTAHQGEGCYWQKKARLHSQTQGIML